MRKPEAPDRNLCGHELRYGAAILGALQCALHDSRFSRNHSEVRKNGRFRLAASLLPISQSGNRDTVAPGKFRLRQTENVANAAHTSAGRHRFKICFSQRRIIRIRLGASCKVRVPQPV